VSTDICAVDGKIVFITGASSGLGRHFAEMLATRGATVICGARRVDRLQELVDRITSAGGKAMAVALDVVDRGSVNRAFDEAEKVFGTPEVLICNAGATGQKPFLEMDEALWDNVVDVNLKGVWNVAQEGARRMVGRNVEGSIICISSIIAERSFRNLTHYGASKAGVNQLTRIMADELAAHKIRVNAISPGYMMTDMVSDYYETEAGKKDLASLPLGRAGRLEELDGQLLLLASDASSYMSGGIFTIDAAHSVRLG
jgi:NAD(P)-dependent dehydrogenase (short-subunit alcohol dehydrogenase family)